MREFLKCKAKISNHNPIVVVCDASSPAGGFLPLAATPAREGEVSRQMKD